MLPLGTDPSVSTCAISDMELVVWVYWDAHKFRSDRSCARTRMYTHAPVCGRCALYHCDIFISHTCSLGTLTFVSCPPPPALKHNTHHLPETVSSSRSTPCSSTSTFSWESSVLIFDLCRKNYEGTTERSKGSTGTPLVYELGEGTHGFEVFRAAICAKIDSQGGGGGVFFLPLSN